MGNKVNKLTYAERQANNTISRVLKSIEKMHNKIIKDIQEFKGSPDKCSLTPIINTLRYFTHEIDWTELAESERALFVERVARITEELYTTKGEKSES